MKVRSLAVWMAVVRGGWRADPSADLKIYRLAVLLGFDWVASSAVSWDGSMDGLMVALTVVTMAGPMVAPMAE